MISAQQDLSKVRAKLTERQSDVLSLVEQHWMLTDRPIEPGEVAEQMAKELGDNARRVVFALVFMRKIVRISPREGGFS